MMFYNESRHNSIEIVWCNTLNFHELCGISNHVLKIRLTYNSTFILMQLCRYPCELVYNVFVRFKNLFGVENIELLLFKGLDREVARLVFQLFKSVYFDQYPTRDTEEHQETESQGVD